jgi:very-short-patch-repair endonuclease
VIGRDQLLRAGLSEDRIRGLIARRELVEMAPAVYSPRPVPESMRQRLWAAALWSDGGVISHRSAAHLWKMPVESSRTVHVTVADRRFRKPVAGVRLHRVPLGRLHRTSYDGLPVTDRSRTVIDLLRTERFDRAGDLLDRAVQQGWIDELSLAHAISSEPGRTGNVQLRWLLAGIEPGAHAESERLLHRILRRGGLSGWVPQYPIVTPGGTVYADVAFPAQRLVIEVDGQRHHVERFEADRTRQNGLVARGWRVLRFTWARLTQQPDAVLAEIVQLLAA